MSGGGKVQLVLDPAVLARIASPAAEAPAPPSQRAAPPAAERPRRVLVCDDSRTVREAIARMLANEGYVVDQAADGEEAWRMLDEVHYDLVVSDVEMPRLSGAELMTRVRERHPGLPVVAISARAGRERARGADAFLAKPVARQELVARAADLVGVSDSSKGRCPGTSRRCRATIEFRYRNPIGAGHERTIGRPSRHAGSHDPPDPGAPADARLRHRPAPRAGHRGRGRGQPRLAVSRAPPPGAPRLA